VTDNKSVTSGSYDEYQGGEIRLDKEGRWFHEGVEITHQLTLDLFSSSIHLGQDGAYYLIVGPERARIVVEDTPYVVRRVTLEPERALLLLNDRTEETLDPTTLRVGADNVLYCSVKTGAFRARFLRPAYYQLMERLEENQDGYAVRLGNKLWPIRSKE
jgi:uncharacterized protein